MPKGIENKVVEYLQEYKKTERNNKLEFVGTSIISKNISEAESEVYNICVKLQKEEKIIEATVHTQRGNYFGYRIKDLIKK